MKKNIFLTLFIRVLSILLCMNLYPYVSSNGSGKGYDGDGGGGQRINVLMQSNEQIDLYITEGASHYIIRFYLWPANGQTKPTGRQGRFIEPGKCPDHRYRHQRRPVVQTQCQDQHLPERRQIYLRSKQMQITRNSPKKRKNSNEIITR